MKATTSVVTIGTALGSFESGSPISGREAGFSGEVGTVMVFVNLGYSKLDDGLAEIAEVGLPAGNPISNGWSVDQTSGKVTVGFYGDVNLNGNSIINVSKILGMDGKWKIDEEGNLVAETVTTKKLCLEDVCVTKEELKILLEKAGISSATEEVGLPSGNPISPDLSSPPPVESSASEVASSTLPVSSLSANENTASSTASSTNPLVSFSP